jgi:hypothetical protein
MLVIHRDTSYSLGQATAHNGTAVTDIDNAPAAGLAA